MSLLWTNSADTQSFYGSIVGIVQDKSGAVIRGVKVKATQTETNETRTATSDDAGIYTLPTLPAGNYTVSISKSGFALYEENNIVLAINTTARVDARLRVSSQPFTVRISANTAELQTDRTDVHGVVTADELQQLPQPTRTYEGLIGLLPGVTPPQPNAGGTNNPA